MVQPITHFLENTPGPYYKVVQITSLSPTGRPWAYPMEIAYDIKLLKQDIRQVVLLNNFTTT